MNVEHYLDEYQDLEQSYSHDLVTSSVIYDAQFNSLNTIVLGTFGKVILMYFYNECENKYELRRDFSVKHSIMGLLTCNLTMNCSNDLIILTLNGVHICQYDPNYVINLINQKYEQNESNFDFYFQSKQQPLALDTKL